MKPYRPVLLLDDEHYVTRALSFLLENNSLKCIVRNTPNDVIQIMEKESPLVVILDINMPGKDGFEVCKQIRALEKFSDTKIIILSGRGRKEDKEDAYKFGADDYMEKPFSPIELRDKVKSIYGIA